MSVDIKLKHSSQAGKVPTAGDLTAGEICLNTADVKAYMLDDTGSVVTLVGGDSPIDDRYVDVDGDNMTGDLTLGTDKITLDAGDGSAEFAGGAVSVESGGTIRTAASGTGLTLGTTFPTSDSSNSALEVKAGATTSTPNTGTTVFKVTPSGSATFSGGNIKLNAGGAIQSAGGLYSGFNFSNNSYGAYIQSSGAASFAGETNIGDIYTGGGTRLLPRGEVYIREDNGAAGVFNVNSGSTAASDATITFLANGAATFSGSISSKALNSYPFEVTDGTTNMGGLYRDADGAALYIKNSNGDNPAAVALKADGSGSFAGGSTVAGGTEIKVGNGQAAVVTNDGFGKATLAGSAFALTNTSGTNTVFFDTGTGAATFDGHLKSDKYLSSDNVVLYQGVSPADDSKNYGFAVTNGSNGNLVGGIATDGSAKFNNFVWSNRTSGTDSAFYATENGVEKVNIRAGGSATLAGNITSGPKTISSQTRYTTFGTSFNVGAATGFCFAHYGSGNNVLAGIKENGYGEFTGAVSAGGGSTPYGFIGYNGFSAGSNDYAAILGACYNAGGRVFLGVDAQNSATKTSQIFASGQAVFNGTVSAQGSVLTSDARFKTNITPAGPQLADVVRLGNQLKNWNWTEDAPVADKDTRFLGLIAQELEEVCPTLVTPVERTKQGKELTPEQVIPAVYEDKVVPAEYKTIVVPAKLGPKGEEIVPASTEEVLVTPEYTEQVLVKEEEIIPATYEELDDSYKAIKSDVFIMKLLGAVAELKAEVDALKSTTP